MHLRIHIGCSHKGMLWWLLGAHLLAENDPNCSRALLRNFCTSFKIQFFHSQNIVHLWHPSQKTHDIQLWYLPPCSTYPSHQSSTSLARLVDHLSCLHHCAVAFHAVAGQELLEVLLRLLGIQATLLGRQGMMEIYGKPRGAPKNSEADL